MRPVTKGNRIMLSVECRRGAATLALVERAPDGIRVLGAESREQSTVDQGETALGDFIRSFMRAHPSPVKEAILTFTDTDAVAVKYVTLPVIAKKEIKKAVEWQLREDASFNPEKIIWDWRMVHESVNADGARTRTLLCLLVNRAVIESALSALHGCSLKPACVTAGPWNYAHILRRLEPSAAVSAVLDVGSNFSTLTVYREQSPAFVRNILFSRDRFTRSLIQTLNTEHGRIELTPGDAERIRDTVGIPEDENQTLGDNLTALHVISLLRPLLENAVKDIKRSFDYFTSHYEREPPATLYIAGVGASLKNISRYLAGALSMPVEILSLPSSIQSDHPEGISPEVMSAAAAVFCSPGDMDLLGRTIRNRHRELLQNVPLRPVAAAAAVFVLIASALLAIQEYTWRQRLASVRESLVSMGGIKELKQRVDAREQLLRTLRRKSMPAEEILVLLSAVVPQGVLLEEIQVDWERKTMSIKGTVTGNTDAEPAVLTKLVKDIEQSAYSREARLVNSRINDDGNYEFEVHGDFPEE
jgi:type IV pilus assembly protein PilM